MVKKIINFSREYTKLGYPLFTTIRGEHWFKEMDYHMKKITIKKQPIFHAFPRCFKVMYLEDIPIELLEWDVHPIEIFDQMEYCLYVNDRILDHRFYRTMYPEDLVTLILLEKATVATLDQFQFNKEYMNIPQIGEQCHYLTDNKFCRFFGNEVVQIYCDKCNKFLEKFA